MKKTNNVRVLKSSNKVLMQRSGHLVEDILMSMYNEVKKFDDNDSIATKVENSQGKLRKIEATISVADIKKMYQRYRPDMTLNRSIYNYGTQNE